MNTLFTMNVNNFRTKFLKMCMSERNPSAGLIGVGSILLQSKCESITQKSMYFQCNIDHFQWARNSVIKSNCYSYLRVSRSMAGHAKWQNIKSTKEKNDRMRSILFNRHSLYIRKAIQEGGSNDPKVNSKLAAAIEMAKNSNVTSNVIQNALKGFEQDKDNLQPLILEIIGPGGSNLIMEALTSRTKKTLSEVRYILKKHISIIAQAGGALYSFNQKGVIIANKELEETPSAEQAMEDAIEAGAEEVVDMYNEDSQRQLQFICDPKSWSQVAESLRKRGFSVKESGLTYIPIAKIKLSSEVELEIFEKLCVALEELPELTKLHHNVDTE